MEAQTKAHVDRLAATFAKHGTDADKALAQGVIDALVAAHPSKDGRLPPTYMSQFRTICLNAASVLPVLRRRKVTPAALATLPAKEMASELKKKEEATIAEEEREADILTESYSIRCGVCGMRKLSMSNANILTDLEECESWKKMEMEDDFCYCDTLEDESDEEEAKKPTTADAGGTPSVREAAASTPPAAGAKRPREAADDGVEAPTDGAAKKRKLGSLL